MLKLTKTGIGLLTKQYRSVLRKCLLLNLGLFLFSTSTYGGFNEVMTWGGVATYGWFDMVKRYDAYWATKPEGVNTTFDCTSFGCGYYTEVANVVTTGPYTPTDAEYGETIQIHKLMYASNHYDYSSADEALITINSTLKAVSNSLYNYYYTFRVDERVEAIDYTSFFQKDFSTLQKVDLQSKNPTHLGAFAKCDEVCPRPSERFVSSLSQEEMFKNNASVDAGTFSICSLQIENVNEKLSNVFEA